MKTKAIFPGSEGSRLDAPHPKDVIALVVLLVVSCGISVGLWLQAVQAAREVARRMRRPDNLKQIGLATLNHGSTFRPVPHLPFTEISTVRPSRRGVMGIGEIRIERNDLNIERIV